MLSYRQLKGRKEMVAVKDFSNSSALIAVIPENKSLTARRLLALNAEKFGLKRPLLA